MRDATDVTLERKRERLSCAQKLPLSLASGRSLIPIQDKGGENTTPTRKIDDGARPVVRRTRRGLEPA
jgi:hypothetical protein